MFLSIWNKFKERPTPSPTGKYNPFSSRPLLLQDYNSSGLPPYFNEVLFYFLKFAQVFYSNISRNLPSQALHTYFSLCCQEQHWQLKWNVENSYISLHGVNSFCSAEVCQVPEDCLTVSNKRLLQMFLKERLFLDFLCDYALYFAL